MALFCNFDAREAQSFGLSNGLVVTRPLLHLLYIIAEEGSFPKRRMGA
jgi:hypothetical protein